MQTILLYFLIVQALVRVFLLLPQGKEAQANGASWHDSNWLYRKPISIINGTADTSANHQVSLMPGTL
jgi:hypothetical protein